MVDERDWIRWMDFEVGDRDEPTFMCMLGGRSRRRRGGWRRAHIHAYVGAAAGCGVLRTDAYGVHGCPPVNKHRLVKGGVVNRNEGFHSALRGKLNRRAEGYSKTAGMLTLSLAPAWLKLGWLQHACTCWEYPLTAITFKLMRHLLYLFGFGGGISRANRGDCA